VGVIHTPSLSPGEGESYPQVQLVGVLFTKEGKSHFSIEKWLFVVYFILDFKNYFVYTLGI